MYNRKFNIKRDFEAVSEYENKISTIIDKIPNKEDSKTIEDDTLKIFSNKYKK